MRVNASAANSYAIPAPGWLPSDLHASAARSSRSAVLSQRPCSIQSAAALWLAIATLRHDEPQFPAAVSHALAAWPGLPRSSYRAARRSFAAAPSASTSPGRPVDTVRPTFALPGVPANARAPAMSSAGAEADVGRAVDCSQPLHLVGRQRRTALQEQRGGSGGLRCGHRRPVHPQVARCDMVLDRGDSVERCAGRHRGDDAATRGEHLGLREPVAGRPAGRPRRLDVVRGAGGRDSSRRSRP